MKINGKRYCLIRLGFGLNVAPHIIRSVFKAVVGHDEVNSATSSYINESICPVVHVKAHLERFGLTSKDPELLRNGTRVLSFQVKEEHGRLQKRREDELPTAPNVFLHRSNFSLREIDQALTSVWLTPCCDRVCQAQSECCNNWMRR